MAVEITVCDAVSLDSDDPVAASEGEAKEVIALSVKPQAKSGAVSYYGAGFAGRSTANGETFDPSQMTAAHKTLPFGTMVKVTGALSGKSVTVHQ